MSNEGNATTPIWNMLEELYLAPANHQAASKYAGSSDAEKWAILVGFAADQVTISRRWAAILQDLPARNHRV